MRPYTGKQVVRKGWRMQDKRVRPGASDYWVHDQDGRPLLRVNSPSHEALTERLRPIARLLRDGLDHAGAESTKIALVFDRAGAFPSEMAELRNAGFEFVTYERGPWLACFRRPRPRGSGAFRCSARSLAPSVVWQLSKRSSSCPALASRSSGTSSFSISEACT